jgi:photosystem II stability/assembly factor-like uncharacterized protein
MPRTIVCATIATVLVLLLAVPGSTGASWRQEGPFMGSVKALAIDPSSPETVYAGTHVGGIFKSLDGGATWKLSGAELVNRVVTWIQVHPGRSDTVYAGTQTRGGTGLWRSTDAGATWQAINLPIVGIRTVGLRIAISPADPDLMIIPNVNIHFRSTDGGATWQELRVTGMDVASVVFHPGDASVAYACGSASSGTGLRVSSDGGATWQEMGGSGLESAPRGVRLAIDPVEPSVLYMARYRGLYKSSDGGDSWSHLTGGLDPAVEIYDIALDPKQSGTLFVTTDDEMYRSTDGGRSWSDIDRDLGGYRARSVVVHPGNSKLVLAGSSAYGVFKSSDGGSSWQVSSTGLAAAWIKMLAVDPQSDGALFAQTSVGLYRRSAGGDWREVDQPFCDKQDLRPGQIVFDAGSPSTIFVPDRARLYRSGDRGTSWQAMEIKSKRSMLNPLKAEPEFNSLAQDPANPKVLYGGAWSATMKQPGQAIFKTSDGGRKWTEAGAGVPAEVIAMLRSARQGMVYAVTGSGSIYRTVDQGGSWSLMSARPPFSEPRDLVVDPSQPEVIYVATEDGLYRSGDGGKSWSNTTTELQYNDVEAVVVGSSGGVFIGTYRGVQSSIDGGKSWSAFGGELPNQDVRALALDRSDPPRLYAGTAGGSVFSTRVDG